MDYHSNNVPAPELKHPRQVRLRSAVLVSSLVTFLIVVVTLSTAVLAFWLGSRDKPNTVQQQRQTVVQEGEVIADVTQKTGRSVVSITTNRQSTTSYNRGVSQGAGTGIIISEDGLILTNKHVIPEGATVASITTHDGEVYTAVKTIGRDPLNDLAIIKVENPKNFTAAKLANSDEVRPGQKVIAIGNALGQYQNTVTTGIISGIGRPVAASDRGSNTVEQLTNLFQTDAAINSGNSGGPLIDFNGSVIGVNTAVAVDAQGIGFAIPINEAKGIIESVRRTGRVSRPYIGVRYVTLDAEVSQRLGVQSRNGAYIIDESGAIVAGSPADKANLRRKDVIVKINGEPLTSSRTLNSIIGRYKVGDSVELTLLRSGQEMTVRLQLAEAAQ